MEVFCSDAILFYRHSLSRFILVYARNLTGNLTKKKFYDKINREINKRSYEMKTTTFPIYSRNLAIFLQVKGFQLVHVEPNTKFPQYQVYFFIKEKGLFDAMEEYKHK